MPDGAWQHMFPAGRQLLQLTHLGVPGFDSTGAAPIELPYLGADKGRSIVSCCPSLQSLDLWNVPYSVHLLASLQQLSSLSALRLSADHGRGLSAAEVCESLGELTGLRELAMGAFRMQPQALLPLAQLRYLTALQYLHRIVHDEGEEMHYTAQVGGVVALSRFADWPVKVTPCHPCSGSVCAVVTAWRCARWHTARQLLDRSLILPCGSCQDWSDQALCSGCPECCLTHNRAICT